MNIYLVQQDIVKGYDTYDSFVCVAESEQEAREMHPSEYVTHHKDGVWYSNEYEHDFNDWVEFKDIDKVKVTSIGVAFHYKNNNKIIIASFNAG